MFSFLFFCGNFFFILVIKKNSKRRIFCQRFVAFRKKNSQLFKKEIISQNNFLHSTEFFLVESKFSACFLSFGVFFIKQFAVISSVFFLIGIFFLELLLLSLEKLAKYI